MIVVAGYVDLVDPAKMPEFLEKSRPLQQATRDEEPGCEFYVFSEDPCVKGRIAIYELWDTSENLNLHFQHANYKNMGALFGEIGIAGGPTEKFRCDHREPVYDDTFTPRGEFFNA